MSFWTDVNFVRPGPPPRITAGDLLRFADRIAGTALVTDGRLRSIKLKFGSRVDRDSQPASKAVRIDTLLYAHREIDWDVANDSSEAAAAAAASLKADSRAVYRAHLHFDFGTLDPRIADALHTECPDGSGRNLSFFDVSIRMDVINASSLGGDAPVQVGWIAVGFGGNGHLWPWTPADVCQRIAESSTLRSVEAVCRATFPAASQGSLIERVNPLRRRGVARARRALGDFWPFDDAFPNDWAWAISESG